MWGFWECAERVLRGLSEDAASEAIRRPSVRDGIGIADDPLTGAYRDNHGYPSLVQHWGGNSGGGGSRAVK